MSITLVTGGAGFIGSHIAEELVSRGERVRVVDNFLTGRKVNIAPFEDKIDFIEGDIRDAALCRSVVKGVDFVLHQAALPSVPRSVENPSLTNEINVTGTLNLLAAARDEGVRSFVFASSSSVYGDDPRLPKEEEMGGMPLSPYAVSKLTGEKYCQVFHHLYGFSTVCLRYFNVFGPRQDPTSQYAAAVPIFITRIMSGKAPVIFGDGTQSRDFTYVRNVVEANILASQSEKAAGQVINIACGDRITVLSLIERISAILERNISPVHEAERTGDIKHSFAAIAKAERILDYRPVVSFEEGLDRTIAWYKQQEEV